MSDNNNDDCRDLKTIQYKTQLLKGSNFNFNTQQQSNSDLIEDLLDQERNTQKPLIWTKLEKNICIQKLNDYADKYGDINNLNEEDIINLKEYLLNAFLKQRLSKTKEVDYDKDNQVILNIPNLIFNKNSKKYTLRKTDKKTSALSSLGKGRVATRKNKQNKNNEDIK